MGLTSIYNLYQFHYVSKVLIKQLFSAFPRPYRIFQLTRAVINLFCSEQRRIQCMKKHEVVIPVVCVFSVTNQCNLACKGCYAQIHPNGGQLSIKEIDKIIRNVLEYGTSIFVITGGEPLLVRDLIPTLGKIRQSLFYLFTNGLLLDEDKIRQLHSCLNIMPVISFEGTDDFTDSRRGPGTASIIKSVIQNLKSHHILFGLSVTATHQNLDVITSKTFLDEIKAMGALCLFIIDYFPVKADDDNMQCLSDEDKEMKKMALVKRKKDTRLIIFNLPLDESPDGLCVGGGKGLIHIDASGRVGPCPFINQAMGNILEREYIDILKSDMMSAFREKASGRLNRPCSSVIPAHPVKSIARKHIFSRE